MHGRAGAHAHTLAHEALVELGVVQQALREGKADVHQDSYNNAEQT